MMSIDTLESFNLLRNYLKVCSVGGRVKTDQSFIIF